MAGLSGAIVSDMILYGDLRDLSIEGSRFAQGQPYDKLIFGMAAIGVGLSESQLFSFGATTLVKVGASIVKVAKKMGKLSRSFVWIATAKLSKAIDFKSLRRLDYSSPSAVKKEAKKIAKSLNTPYLKKVFKNIDAIHKNTDSYADTIALLKYVDDPKDLQRVANISRKYKKNTKVVFKVLGKKVIKGIVKGTARIIKWTSLLIAQMISLVISILMGIFAFFTKWFTCRHLLLKYVGSDGVVATDLRSTNGTYVDGKKLPANIPTVLKRGERLILGSEDVVYSY